MSGIESLGARLAALGVSESRVAEPSLPSVVVKTCKMPDDMRDAACECVTVALSVFDQECEVAEYLKRVFDGVYGPKWHCIVGRHYASHVSYEPQRYIYIKVGDEVILLFKSGAVADS